MTDMIPSRKASEDEEPPDFENWEDPSTAVSGESTRDDLLDVALQLREPTSIPEIAERADRGEDSARDYMHFFSELGIVEKVTESPLRYRVDMEYLRWRRAQRIEREYTQDEIAGMLSETKDLLEEYESEFGTSSPDDISVADYADEHDMDVEEVWREVSEWKTEDVRLNVLDEALDIARRKVQV